MIISLCNLVVPIYDLSNLASLNDYFLFKTLLLSTSSSFQLQFVCEGDDEDDSQHVCTDDCDHGHGHGHGGGHGVKLSSVLNADGSRKMDGKKKVHSHDNSTSSPAYRPFDLNKPLNQAMTVLIHPPYECLISMNQSH